MSLSIIEAFAPVRLFQYTLLVALVCAFWPARLAAQPLAGDEKEAVVFTETDRANALKYFEETRADFLAAITSLSEAQLNFKTGPERWSVAEVAEHIIVAENPVLPLITERVLTAPVADGKDDYRVKDQVIWMAVTNRSTKFTAPEPVQPNGRWKTVSELISNFNKTRGTTIDFIKTTKVDLRNHFAENPLMGVIDAYQWLIFLNAHSHRHLDQIREIKADPKFPQS